MDREWLKRKQKIEGRYSGWHSYDINFDGQAPSLATVINDGYECYPFVFFERIVSCVQDFLKKPLAKSTVLDLGCLEGLASFVLAKRGAKKVLGVDGREANIAKAEFTKEVFGFNNITFNLSDVRDLNYKAKSFDVVLALGIAYHLDTPDLFHFVENLFKWTRGITIIDTHIAYLPKIVRKYKGKNYSGIIFKEFPNYTNESSIGNPESFWPTQASLFNLLTSVGYTGIYEVKYPRGGRERETDDRLTIVATKETRPETLLKSGDFEERNPRIVVMQQPNIDLINEEPVPR